MTDASICLLNRCFNLQLDTDVRDLLNFMQEQEHEDTTVRLVVECFEEHFYLFTNEHYILQRLYMFETLVLFVEELILYCQLFGIPCWLHVTMW